MSGDQKNLVIELADKLTDEQCRMAFDLFREQESGKGIMISEEMFSVFREGFRGGSISSIVTLKDFMGILGRE